MLDSSDEEESKSQCIVLPNCTNTHASTSQIVDRVRDVSDDKKPLALVRDQNYLIEGLVQDEIISMLDNERTGKDLCLRRRNGQA